MFICNRPLSAVLAALAAAAAFVVADEVYRQHPQSMTETAETSAARVEPAEPIQIANTSRLTPEVPDMCGAN